MGGVGSPLGPTMADFYMADLENKLLSETKISNPIKYLRYVDDTICIFNSRSHISHFIRRLTKNSVLNFTYEVMCNDTFNFLDVMLNQRADGSFDTSVYVKPTDKGLYANYSSHIPAQYKNSVISSLVNRAIKVCSTPENRTAELNRITQILVNNGYPQSLIDRTVKMKLNQHHNSNASSDNDTDSQNVEIISFYAELHNVPNFSQDTKRLRTIITYHVSPADVGNIVKITTYYRPLKISSMFTTRVRPIDAEKTSLVYQFTCPKPSCHEVQYIGHTNSRLKTRVKQHRWRSSPIYKHYFHEHQDEPPPVDEHLKSFKILYSNCDLFSIKIAEAILIKNYKPFINTRYDELHDFLRLF